MSTPSETGFAVDTEKQPRAEVESKYEVGAPRFPEGGCAGWLTVVGAWFMIFATFGNANTFAVFESYYALVKYPNESSSTIAWVGSVQTFLMFMMAAVAGPLFDKGYFYHVTIVGAALYIFSFFMVSLCKEFWQTFLAHGVLNGIGMGLLFVPAIGVVSQYFFKHRGFATGLVTTGSSLGGVCLPIMVNKLVARVSFAQTVQYTGCLLIGCIAIAFALIRPFGGVRGHKAGQGSSPSPLTFLREPSYVVLCFAVFLVAWGMFFPNFYIQYFAELAGTSKDLTFYMTAILNAASTVGRSVPNLVADHLGPLNLICFMSLWTSAMAISFFGASKTTAGLVVFAVLYGIAQGGIVSLLSPVALSWSKGQADVGARIAMPMLFMSLAAVSGSPLGGHLFDKYGLPGAIGWSGAVIALGTLMFGALAIQRARAKGTWIV